MNHDFDYDNADRKDLLERCKSFEIAVDAQHSLCMRTFKERDTYRDLCGELIEKMREIKMIVNSPLEAYYIACEAIKKAEALLGENNAT